MIYVILTYTHLFQIMRHVQVTMDRHCLRLPGKLFPALPSPLSPYNNLLHLIKTISRAGRAVKVEDTEWRITVLLPNEQQFFTFLSKF